MSITFIDGVTLSQMCDYSFGDQASIICGIEGGWMKPANLNNNEFIEKVNLISRDRKYMTLFIDNIRLYKRHIKARTPEDQNWINSLMDNNDLLNLCKNISNMNFIIFCNLEDTPIDEYIEGKIPDNVIRIYSSNAVYNNQKVVPFPYGIQRDMNPSDTKKDILKRVIETDVIVSNLLYINHNVYTNSKERSGIYELFESYNWVTVDRGRLSYEDFLKKIKSHKFVICPIGNAIDCHRNWEVIYLNRVPIMKKNKYLETLFEGFPVLFVDDYSEINEEMLLKNEYLFQNALDLNIYQLDIYNVYNSIIEKEIKSHEMDSI